jgi:hypothetical protein
LGDAGIIYKIGGMSFKLIFCEKIEEYEEIFVKL